MASIINRGGWEDRVTPAVDRLLETCDPFISPSRIIAQQVNSMSGDLLVVGFANWTDALYLAQHGNNVTGVDVSAEGIATFMANARRLSVDHRITPVESDIRSFNPDKQFDGVLSHHTLHIFTPGDRKKVVEKIQGLTRAGGLNILTGISASDSSFTLAARRKLMSVGEMNGLYGGGGWEILECREITPPADDYAHADGTVHRPHTSVILAARKKP
jgi:hypothetical protein